MSKEKVVKGFLDKKELTDPQSIFLNKFQLKTPLEQIKKYYEGKSINVEIKDFYISSNKFSETIDNLDNILINSSDEVVITEIINQGLNKYEEIILNGS